MQQRAALVRALSFKPSVLLMDEPFGALDAFTREEMNHLVEEIWLETPTTIVLITHSIEEAIFLSDRIIVMSARPGRVAKEYEVPFPRPRSLEIMATKEVFDLTNAIKLGDRRRGQKSRFAPVPSPRRPGRPVSSAVSETDAIPEFKKSKPAADQRGRHHQHVRADQRAGHPLDARGDRHRPRRGGRHRRHRTAAQPVPGPAIRAAQAQPDRRRRWSTISR
jgi:ABC-type oligopeptide transport system ATPase subunit